MNSTAKKYNLSRMRWLVIVLSITTVSVVAWSLDKTLVNSTVTSTPEYVICEAQPTSECLADIAISALPVELKYLGWGRLRHFAEAGKSEFVRTHTSKYYTKLPKDVARGLARIERANAAEFAELPLPGFPVRGGETDIDNSGNHYISTLWLVADHTRWGGGKGYIIQAEKAAYRRRGPIDTSPGLRSMIHEWQQAMIYFPSNSISRSWQNMAKILLFIGQPTRAGTAIRDATRFGVDVLPVPLLKELVHVGQADSALFAAMKISEKKYRASALAGISKSLADMGELERANDVAQTAIDLLPSLHANRRIQIMKVLIGALYQSGSTEDAIKMADQVRGLADETSHFRRLTLLDAAEAQINAQHNSKAIVVIDAAIKDLPTHTLVNYFLDNQKMRHEFLQQVAELLCAAGQYERAMETLKDLPESFRQNAVGDFYGCAYDSLGNQISPDSLANQLNLDSALWVYLKKASSEIITGDELAAIQTMRHVLSIEWPRISTITNRSWENAIIDLLRLSVAVKDSELTRSILSKILAEARIAEATDQDVSIWLITSAAIVRKQL